MEKNFANPAPIGLAGFGMTTILLNIHNAGFIELDSMILAMGIFIGGIAQIIAGKLEFQKGNTFGMTAFTLYGSFWLSLVAIIVMPIINNPVVKPATSISMGFYLLIWGIFSIFMTLAVFKKGNFALRFIFVTLDVLFLLLAIANFARSSLIHTIAGYEGIVCGGSALYLSVAEVINESYGKEVFPV
ncbi:MAG TPA: acetate uptake transporter [Spirochaetota bacterium]|nr:acetate uptake transporter [Spirochaetota bacterium]HOM38474.1 acetate uptake transporter [Spirochaetota bacterium]HPQ49014.1 acetate uptake transporter [Spirochaetota bacterium]